MTISRAQMGTQLKGDRVMKKMKKYANGNMIDPDIPGVAKSLRPKLRPGGVPEGEPSSVGPSGGTRGTPEDAARLVAERKRRQREAAQEERLRREQMKRRAAPAPAPAPMVPPAPTSPPAPPAGVMAGGMAKPPMPMAKKGGKVKKMKKGGKVRGAGCAKRGIRKAKMR
jgi:hypothetical protein|tara:strand:- start:1136 stop:1642 length:507 start_codon:yes stop_codon:yes gene_type:complete